MEQNLNFFIRNTENTENKNNKDNVTYINTECSPSHLFGNLSVTDKSILYIHNSEIQPRVIVVDRKLLDEVITDNISSYVSKLNSSETNEMVVIKCVNILNSFYVAVGLYGGFKLWSGDGNRLLFNIPAKVRTTDKPYAFITICEYRSTNTANIYDSIICTDNYGQVFLVSGFGQVWKAKLLYSYDGVTTTASCSSLHSDLICVGYETGEVYVFRITSGNLVEVATKIDSANNLPCLAMGIITPPTTKNRNLLAIGYLNGEVRLHNLSTNNFELVASLGAHLRMISNLITFKDNFITCGDDCFVNIWKIDNENNITNVGNYELKDKMPLGVCIIEKEKSITLLVSCYDYTSLALIQNLNI